MRCVLQRVSQADVLIDNIENRKIGKGLLILLGVCDGDSQQDINWLISKILQMRIFSDSEGKMNLSVQDIKGSIMVISQFTLYASTKKGNRPSFIKAAKPEVSLQLYKEFLNTMRLQTDLIVEEGNFGSDMQVTLTNDGPVTIIIDSTNRE